MGDLESTLVLKKSDAVKEDFVVILSVGLNDVVGYSCQFRPAFLCHPVNQS